MSSRAWTSIVIFVLLLGLSCAGRSVQTSAADAAIAGATAADAAAAEAAPAAEPATEEPSTTPPTDEPARAVDETASTMGEAAESAVPECPPLAEASGRQGELDAIADLLIDGRPAAAKTAAEALLSAGALPPQVAARGRQLLAKAEELSPAPAPPLPPFPSASFAVLQAQVGGGFSAGASGRLQFAEEGVTFFERGRSEAAWAVDWDLVLGLTPDEGLWDARHPLVLRERNGSTRYFALIDNDGDSIRPDPLLAAFERARREAARRRAASAAEGAGGSPGKEQ
jgi:hypothetical protein